MSDVPFKGTIKIPYGEDLESLLEKIPNVALFPDVLLERQHTSINMGIWEYEITDDPKPGFVEPRPEHVLAYFAACPDALWRLEHHCRIVKAGSVSVHTSNYRTGDVENIDTKHAADDGKIYFTIEGVRAGASYDERFRRQYYQLFVKQLASFNEADFVFTIPEFAGTVEAFAQDIGLTSNIVDPFGLLERRITLAKEVVTLERIDFKDVNALTVLVSEKEVLEHMHENSFRPAGVEHLVAFAARYPHLLGDGPLVALNGRVSVSLRDRTTIEFVGYQPSLLQDHYLTRYLAIAT